MSLSLSSALKSTKRLDEIIGKKEKEKEKTDNEQVIVDLVQTVHPQAALVAQLRRVAPTAAYTYPKETDDTTTNYDNDFAAPLCDMKVLFGVLSQVSLRIVGHEIEQTIIKRVNEELLKDGISPKEANTAFKSAFKSNSNSKNNLVDAKVIGILEKEVFSGKPMTTTKTIDKTKSDAADAGKDSDSEDEEEDSNNKKKNKSHKKKNDDDDNDSGSDDDSDSGSDDDHGSGSGSGSGSDSDSDGSDDYNGIDIESGSDSDSSGSGSDSDGSGSDDDDEEEFSGERTEVGKITVKGKPTQKIVKHQSKKNPLASKLKLENEDDDEPHKTKAGNDDSDDENSNSDGSDSNSDSDEDDHKNT